MEIWLKLFHSSKYALFVWHRVLFQQEGAHCHLARSTMAWFGGKGIIISPWLAQSPDLNPIELLSKIMKRKKRLEKQPCKNMEEPKEAIFQIWNSISSATTDSLVLSMPRSCAAVIAALEEVPSIN